MISTIERLASGNSNESPKRLAVVVSAQGNTTDWLLDAADYATSGNLEAAEACVDRVAELAIANAVAVGGRGEVAAVRKFWNLFENHTGHVLAQGRDTSIVRFCPIFGERLSAFMMTQILNARSIDAIFVDARSWVETDENFGQAKVHFSNSCLHVNKLWRSWGSAVVVCTGFVGQTSDGRTTTPGRNGSDYTATLLAGALRAEKVVINTDVDGVMTADPRIVQDAVPVAELTYMEALGLADYGTGMFHPRTFIPLIETNVPMYIRNSGATRRKSTRISSNRHQQNAIAGPKTPLKETVSRVPRKQRPTCDVAGETSHD